MNPEFSTIHLVIDGQQWATQIRGADETEVRLAVRAIGETMFEHFGVDRWNVVFTDRESEEDEDAQV